MRCLECGAGIAERAQVCGRCGVWAPVEYQLSVAEDGAADAAHDVAGGPASAAIRTDVGQQRPESASDPEVDGAELAEWVTTREFSTTRLRPGYDIEEVDAFLGAIRDTFLGIREPCLTPEEIRAKQFSTTRLRPGYDEEEVDALLDDAESRLAAQVSARREAPVAEPEPGVADPAAEAAQIRCLECGAENPEAAQVCARCRAPITHQVPGSADRAEDGSDDSIEALPGESVHQTAGQRPGASSRRNAWMLAGLGIVLLVAVTALAASVTMIISRSISSKPSTSPTPTTRSSSLASPVPSDSQVTEDQLQPGDCLTGSDLSLDTSSPWPDLFTVVPCTQQHIAEVFFADNIWSQSLAYPGDDKAYNQADNRCAEAFFKYIRRLQDRQTFMYQIIYPDNTTWPDGDRMVACIAYKPTSQYPGGAPVNYSLDS